MNESDWSFELAFVGKKLVTSPKNFCVGGYVFIAKNKIIITCYINFNVLVVVENLKNAAVSKLAGVRCIG